MRAVSSKPSPRPTFPAYWQDRLAKSQVKVPSLPRPEMDVAPTSTMTSPSLTAYLKTSWPARTRKSNEASAVRSSVPSRPLEDEQELRLGERARHRAVESTSSDDGARRDHLRPIRSLPAGTSAVSRPCNDRA